MAQTPTFSTPIGGQARVGKVVNVGEIHAEHVVLGAEVPTAGAFRLLAPPEPFVGRTRECDLLAEKLRQGGTHLLCGLGGVGKSALALRVAHDLATADTFPDGVFWVPLESAPTPEMAAAWLVSAFGVRGEANPLSALAGLLYDRRPLLVLDNAEAAPATADALLACRGRATVLVTSRDVRVGLVAIPGAPEDLAPLEDRDAADLLRARLGNVPASDEQVQAICELVSGLPLALVLAAAFVARELRGSPAPAAEYLALLRATPLAALDMGERRDTSVRVTFDLSWQRLDDTARRALAVLAYAPGGSVDAAAVAAGLEIEAPTAGLEIDAPTALRTLVSLSLAAREGDRYRAHPLLRHYARQQMARLATALRDCLRRHYLDYARKYQVGADHPYCAPLDAERDNVLGAMAWAWEAQDWGQVIAFASATKYYLQLRGYPHLAREWADRWRQAARHLQDRGEEANALSSLGDVHRMLAEYAAARERYEQALPIYRAIGDRLGEANAIYSLGEIARLQQDFTTASTCYHDVLRIYTEIGGRLGQANVLDSLGELAEAQEHWQEAASWFERALATYQAIGSAYARVTQRNLERVRARL